MSMNSRRGFAGLLTVALGVGVASGEAPHTQQRPNVLFIAIDDLNHWVGHLGRNPQAKTPNIDRLAKRGVTFTHAYCAAPICNPSRTALLSGLRPSTSGVYDNPIDPRPLIPESYSLMSTFRKAGYYVAGAGKIYHHQRANEWDDYFRGGGGGAEPHANGGAGGIRFAPLDCDDSLLADHRITDYVIGQLSKNHAKPFFLALGLHKPHMPWNVPRKYYDMFPLESLELPPIKANDLADLPPAGRRMALAFGDHKAVVEAGKWKEAIQGYLAAIAYTDQNIGRALDALDKSRYKDNTIIVLWGDHGWSLGEKEHWRKFALWEEPTRAPFLWVAPGVTKPNGVCHRTVDFMSVYPTLCDLCGLTTPSHVEGASIRPLLSDPKSAWSKPALTTHHAGNHAVRSERWRYIRYADGTEELYDHEKDPFEWTNLATQKEFDQEKRKLAETIPKMEKPEVDPPEKSAKAQTKKSRKGAQKSEPK